jgi:hypothetical protein
MSYKLPTPPANLPMEVVNTLDEPSLDVSSWFTATGSLGQPR